MSRLRRFASAVVGSTLVALSVMLLIAWLCVPVGGACSSGCWDKCQINAGGKCTGGCLGERSGCEGCACGKSDDGTVCECAK